jgi:rare lipoprotein A
MYKLTAAHNELPLGTFVEVRNQKNGKKVVVKINDRGPFVDDRIIDLSYAAAKKIDMIREGTAPVRIKVLE